MVHLLVTDVVMPRMSGRQLADLLAVELPGLRILFVSGYSAEIVGRHEVLTKGGDYLPKPFSPAALTCKVREMLDAGQPDLPVAATPVHSLEQARSSDTLKPTEMRSRVGDLSREA